MVAVTCFAQFPEDSDGFFIQAFRWQIHTLLSGTQNSRHFPDKVVVYEHIYVYDNHAHMHLIMHYPK